MDRGSILIKNLREVSDVHLISVIVKCCVSLEYVNMLFGHSFLSNVLQAGARLL